MIKQTEPSVSEDPTLAAVRRRSQGFPGYLSCIHAVLCLLWVADMAASLAGRWMALLYGTHTAVGLVIPVAGPDYFVLGRVTALVLVVNIGIVVAYSAYRAAWERRLRRRT
jgi:hypothetical protein